MAVLQGSNSVGVAGSAESAVAHPLAWSDLRIDAGVIPYQQSSSEWFWALVWTAVRQYRAWPPVARWLVPRLAALLFVVLYWLVRLAPYWLCR